MKRSASIATAVIATLSGCVVGVGARVYDPAYHDYHRWDAAEEAHYRIFVGERHEPYREYRRLDRDEQRNYWQWRHSRSDDDRR
jgi:hypothetical protein